MPKNPFVNCKSRKRRKVRIMVQKPATKLYCPRTMVRYDNSPNGYNTVFVCKMCFTCVLSENAVRAHVMRCNEANKKVINPDKKDDDTRYICECCNRVFSRKVALKKHKEQHNKTSDVESEDEFVNSLPRKLMKASNGERVSIENNVDQQDVAVEDITVEDATVEDVTVENVTVEDVTVKDVTVEDVTVEDVTVEDVTVEDITVEDRVNEDVVNEFGAQDDEAMVKQVEYEGAVDTASNEEACSVIEKAAAVALQNASVAAAAAIRHVTATMQSEIDAEVAAYVYRETTEYQAALKELEVENQKAVGAPVFLKCE